MTEVEATRVLDRGFIQDELLAVCNSLGSIDINDGTYMKDRDCKACLREILRFLNADSKEHIARCVLGELNIVKTDLIPLLVQYCDYNEGDTELFNIILRLCANLTSSIIILFDQKEYDNKEEQEKLEKKLLRGLFAYKKSFAEDDMIWNILNTHLRHNTDDEVNFERLVILIRNILHIPVDSTADMGNLPDFDAHSMCIYRMDKCGMLNTIIALASESQKGAEFCFHLTEIIYLMLRDQNPETLALSKSSLLKRKLDDSDVDKKRLAELSAINRREREMNNSITRMGINARFKGSMFTCTNIRTVCDNQLVMANPILDRSSIKFDRGKTELRKAKNKKPLTSYTFMQISDKNRRCSKITYSLKLFCKKFVEKVYNNYMQQIKHNLIQKKAQENDETYYLWSITFFTSFSRHLGLNYDYISETLSTSTLHFIQILITSYQDKIKIEKKEFRETSKRLHVALRAYREILNLIQTIDSMSSDYTNSIESIKKNIFTELDYSTLLLNLLQQYNEPKHSSHYLHDLIHTNHIFLRLLEEYSKSHRLIQAEVDLDEDEEDDDEGEEDVEVTEKDVNDGVNENDLIAKPITDENSIFGDILGEEDSVKDEILVTNRLSEAATPVDDKLMSSDEENPKKVEDGLEVESNLSEKKPSEKAKENKNKKKKKTKKSRKKKKMDLTVSHFITRYCSPEVINAHLHVLQDFKSNDNSTNLAILKFFERIAFDCKNELILCQASVMRCLIDICKYHSSMPGQDGFKKLAIHLIEVFGRMFNKRRWMFQELLFWKNHNDVVEIEMAIDPPAVPAAAAAAETTISQVAGEVSASQLIDEPNQEEALATGVDSLEALRAELWDSDDESEFHNEVEPKVRADPFTESDDDAMDEAAEAAVVAGDEAELDNN